MAVNEIKTIYGNSYIIVAETLIAGYRFNFNRVRLMKHITLAEGAGVVGGAGDPIDPVECSRTHLVEVSWSDGTLESHPVTAHNAAGTFVGHVDKVFDRVGRRLA